MITKLSKYFSKNHKNARHALEKCKELAHHGMNVMTWPSAIRHSKSAERHSKSAEWHSSRASDTQPLHSTLMQFHAISRS